MLKLLVKIVLLSLIYMNQLHAGGNSIGNGGDIVSARFTQIAKIGINSINKSNIDTKSLYYLNQIETAILNTLVSTKKFLILDEREVDAINYPDLKKIEINRSRWNSFAKENAQTQVMLVFHEYLGVAGIDDTNYKISTDLALLCNDKKLRFINASDNLDYLYLTQTKIFEIKLIKETILVNFYSSPEVKKTTCSSDQINFEICKNTFKFNFKSNFDFFQINSLTIRSYDDQNEIIGEAKVNWTFSAISASGERNINWYFY